jgi:tellurite resistance protein TehA-like permease
MRDPAGSFWSTNRFAAISFTCSLIEIVVFLLAIILAVFFGVQFKTPPLVPGIVWILGTAGGIISALVGLFADSRKKVAVVALLTAIGCFFLCGTQMLV